ncbi:hypothetical protein [Frondihabitans peucedani]|uniref:Bulb-type lectin domain-containing protein n=1 Tax=Frondihabitans peucedani TaxID=598626 RepID=A0ABP8E4X4_9MICO
MKSITKRGIAAALTVAALAVGSAVVASPASAYMTVGQTLGPTQAMNATNSQYYLMMRADGDLVVIGNGSERPLWSSGTAGNPGAVLHLQVDDNAVIRSKAGKVIWASGTSRPSENHGLITTGNDGRFNVLDNHHKLRWQSDTTGTDYITPGSSLTAKGYLYPGSARFSFQTDGNLVASTGGKVTWSAHTQNTSPDILRFQSDGNLVLYTAHQAKAVWSSKTAGSKADKLRITPAGKLVLLRGTTVVWTAP